MQLLQARSRTCAQPAPPRARGGRRGGSSARCAAPASCCCRRMGAALLCTVMHATAVPGDCLSAAAGSLVSAAWWQPCIADRLFARACVAVAWLARAQALWARQHSISLPFVSLLRCAVREPASVARAARVLMCHPGICFAACVCAALVPTGALIELIVVCLWEADLCQPQRSRRPVVQQLASSAAPAARARDTLQPRCRRALQRSAAASSLALLASTVHAPGMNVRAAACARARACGAAPGAQGAVYVRVLGGGRPAVHLARLPGGGCVGVCVTRDSLSMTCTQSPHHCDPIARAFFFRCVVCCRGFWSAPARVRVRRALCVGALAGRMCCSVFLRVREN